MTEDKFDIKRDIFEEIEKEKMGDVFTLLCLWSAELSKAFALRNVYYSKMSLVMLRGYRIAGQEKYALGPNAAYLDS